MTDPAYLQCVRELSERLVAAQQPIRVLDAVAWDDSVREAFFAAGCDRDPPVDAAYYQGRPLRFDALAVRATFEELERDLVSRLGERDPAARIMIRMCREYELVIDMLEARGTPEFARLSGDLYGRSTEPVLPGQPDLVELASVLQNALSLIDQSAFEERHPRNIPAEEAVRKLQAGLDASFASCSDRVHVQVDDGIVADAAAGSDYIKLRKGALFSQQEINLLEAHEGWVHVGTTLNGLAQPTCTFLGKGTPATAVTQEGLAVLVEVTSLRSHPARLRRISDRIRAIHLAEQGASFLEVFRALCADDRSADEAWTVAARVFRGGTASVGPFSKDLSYSKGFVLIYNFMHLAVRRGRSDRLPLLFVGKIVLQEIGLLAELLDAGVLAPPRFMPPVFADPSALVSWMAYSNFMNRIDLSQVEPSFEDLLA